MPAAINAFKKGLAIDAKDAAAWNNLGIALQKQKDLPGAIDAWKKTLAIDAKNASAWNCLGVALANQKDLPAAIDAYKKALAIDAKIAKVWTDLGIAFQNQKDLPAAIDAYKKALAIDAKIALAWYNLGLALANQKDRPAAIDAWKKTTALRPDWAEAHCNLGQALRYQGKFAPALRALQKGHDLGSRKPGWSYPSAAWVKECRQLLALDEKLPGVLRGDTASVAELLALADMCQRYKKRYADAATLFAKAFAAEPKWEEDLDNAYRYNAACVAALAAAGKGFEPDKIEAKEKPRLRKKALDWLQADLVARARLLDKNPLSAPKIQDDMKHWQTDPDLAAVRDEKELAKLSAEERADWQRFWSDVRALSQKTRSQPNTKAK